MARNRTNRRGRRGDGSISERTRADGTVVYDTYWHYPDPVTGKIRRACKRGFPTRRDAARHLKTQTAAAEAGSYVPPSRQRLDEYLEQWLLGLRLAPQTMTAYRSHVRRHIAPRIGGIKLSELTAAHLNRLYADLERNGSHTRCCTRKKPCGRPTGSGPLTRTTVRHVHNTLSAALRDAVDSGLLAVSPTARANPPTLKQAKAQRQPFHTWTADELGCFLRIWDDHRFGPLWHLLAATGLRRGEALGLRGATSTSPWVPSRSGRPSAVRLHRRRWRPLPVRDLRARLHARDTGYGVLSGRAEVVRFTGAARILTNDFAPVDQLLSR